MNDYAPTAIGLRTRIITWIVALTLMTSVIVAANVGDDDGSSRPAPTDSDAGPTLNIAEAAAKATGGSPFSGGR